MTFSTPGAEEAIAELVRTGDSNMIVGAGTVLDAETARIAIMKGRSLHCKSTLQLLKLRQYVIVMQFLIYPDVVLLQKLCMH